MAFCVFGAECCVCLSHTMSEFRKQVFHAVARIPTGKVATYGTVAAAIGNPSASRAVGNALKANPYNYENTTCTPMVPCHRVVGKNGLGGFFGRSKIPTKILLLEQEGVLLKDGTVDEDNMLKKII